MMLLSKRDLYRFGAALTVLFAARGGGAVPVPAADPLQRRLLALLSRPDSAATVGRAYLRLRPDEAEADLLVRLLAQSLSGPADLDDEAKLRRAMARSLSADFDQGRLVNVSGWLLAETEARLCALAALSA